MKLSQNDWRLTTTLRRLCICRNLGGLNFMFCHHGFISPLRTCFWVLKGELDLSFLPATPKHGLHVDRDDV